VRHTAVPRGPAQSRLLVEVSPGHTRSLARPF
jgi:hypothetical protein